MVEHLVCNQAVVGSNPVASTKAWCADGSPTQEETGEACDQRGEGLERSGPRRVRSLTTRWIGKEVATTVSIASGLVNRDELRSLPGESSGGDQNSEQERGQATKSAWWMPWRPEPMKDVA